MELQKPKDSLQRAFGLGAKMDITRNIPKKQTTVHLDINGVKIESTINHKNPTYLKLYTELDNLAEKWFKETLVNTPS